MSRRVIIGTRGSDLALAQANWTAGALSEAVPGLEVVVQIIKSRGDQVLHVPLSQMGGKGVFTKELENALLDRTIDLAVHSLKDLPTELPRGLCVAAIPEREDPRDALVTREGGSLADLPQGAVIGTSSLRRKALLLSMRPDLQMRDIRGNVPTRLRKLREEGYDATLLAMAGLRRSGLDHEATEVLGPESLLPAPGQGALGLQCREDDAELRGWLERLHHADTAACVTAERSLLSALGGGCQTPLGTLAEIEGGKLRLRARVAVEDGGASWSAEVSGAVDEAVALGRRAAEALLAQGAHVVQEEGAVPVIEGTPLEGKTVAVTRTRSQSSQLLDELERLGAKTISFPTIEIHPVDPPPAIPGAKVFDWVIFTSANAVSLFAYALGSAEREIASYRDCAICTVGPATAERCLGYGLTVTLTPDQFIADAIADAIERLEGSLEGKRFLIPRGNLARNDLSEMLTAKGAKVSEPVVYETRKASPTEAERKALLDARPDWVVFTSSSTARNFAEILSDDERAVLQQTARYSAIGPRTRETAEEHAMTVAVQPERHDVPGLVAALAQFEGQT
ncbi:MAG: hydroxymethylbilane synthase [Candidatus Hydrogenedens sp.]|nr:hydroxymethylbilane synthase [Candidatus Hydrogenedens sp.]